MLPSLKIPQYKLSVIVIIRSMALNDSIKWRLSTDDPRFMPRLRIGHNSGTDPIVYSHDWSFYMLIRCYMPGWGFAKLLTKICQIFCNFEIN